MVACGFIGLSMVVSFPAVPVRGAPSAAEDLAACQNDDGDLQKRIDICTRVIEDTAQIAEIRAEAHLNRGIALETQDEDEKAIVDYTAAIALNPDYGVLYHYRGLAYERTEQYDLALADYNKAIQLDPEDADALFFRAQAYFDNEEYDRAMADYNEVLKLAPTDAEAYAGRGDVFEAQGQLDKAIADFRKAIELEPDNEEALAGLKRLTEEAVTGKQ